TLVLVPGTDVKSSAPGTMYHYVFCAARAYRPEYHETLLFRKNFSSFQTVVRARAYAGSLKSKAILKELNCPAESNVILNFCQRVNYRKLPSFCRKLDKNYFPIRNSMKNITEKLYIICC
ncbi:hypothetical protein D7V96_05920, partial [bacterium D16-59]